MTLQPSVECNVCEGTGRDPFAKMFDNHDMDCLTCNGYGFVQEEEPRQVRVNGVVTYEPWRDLPDEAYAMMAEAEGICL